MCGAERDEVWLFGGDGRLGIISSAGASVTFNIKMVEVRA